MMCRVRDLCRAPVAAGCAVRCIVAVLREARETVSESLCVHAARVGDCRDGLQQGVMQELFACGCGAGNPCDMWCSMVSRCLLILSSNV